MKYRLCAFPKTGGGYNLEYYLKDHLFSNRIIFADMNVNASINAATEIFEETYYPFGLQQSGFNTSITGVENKYQYSGKEINDEFGLNMYDYGARWYMADLGRWGVNDRLAEKYADMSTYQYAANNPVKYIDVNGDSIWLNLGNDKVLWQNGQLTQNGKEYKGSGYSKDKNGNVTYTGFAGKTMNALGKINSGQSGKTFLVELVNSIQNVSISETAGMSNQYNLNVYWNSNDKSTGLDVNGSSEAPTFITLAHELAHSLDEIFNGNKHDETWFYYGTRSISLSEQYASHIENIIRNEHSIAHREFYGDFESETMRILKPNSSESSNYSRFIKAKEVPYRHLIVPFNYKTMGINGTTIKP